MEVPTPARTANRPIAIAAPRAAHGTPRPTPPGSRRLGRALLGLGGLAVALVGCGKAENTAAGPQREFPNALPEAPRALEVQAAPAWTSSHALAVDEDAVYVADEANGALVVLERDTLQPTRTVPVGQGPAQLAVGPDGTAWVSVRDSGTLVRVDAGADAPSRVIDLGGEPYGVALSRQADRVYVTDHAGGRVVTVDASSGQILEERSVGRLLRGLAVVTGANGEPALVVVQQAGPALYVPVGSNDGLPRTPTALALRHGLPSDLLFDPMRGERLGVSRAMAATAMPGDDGALIVHLETDTGTSEDELRAAAAPRFDAEPATDGYGSSQSGSGFDFGVRSRPVDAVVTRVDADGTVRQAAPALPVVAPSSGEPMTARVAQPSDVNHHPTMSLAFVTGEGSDNVLVLNTGSFDGDPMAHPVAEIAVGMAPRAVAFSPDGRFAYVLNGQSFTVGEIDLTPLLTMKAVEQHAVGGASDAGFGGGEAVFIDVPEGALPPERAAALPEAVATAFVRPVALRQDREAAYGVDPSPAAVRRGRRIFTYARNPGLSEAGQFACATCHPDGTEDGKVWFIKDGPRQTIALAGRLQDTAPFNWLGTKGELKHNMEQTIARMGGHGLDEAELADLEQFLLQGLRPPRNPNLVGDGLDPVQALGKQIFEDPEVGCMSCHIGEASTDGELHDVGSTTEVERLLRQQANEQGADLPPPGYFNTPSLRGLWYTAPYLHNGKADTLYDVLEQTAGTMGATSQLEDDEIDALVAYLLTL
ncbi:MAG: c-type cytochrome [Deltaproteobacteria bacterium]|nr:c-type cytochrome [Deltaproteobacteria bacterium]